MPAKATAVMPAKASTGQRSQALIEFALISPVLLLLVFGIIDIGRAVFYYDTLAHAAREGAREAISASTPLPTDASVLAAVMQQLVGAPVTAPCPQGPVTSATPPSNTAWLYITEFAAPASGSCSAVNPAVGNTTLQVTLRFNLVLITPILSQVTADHIVLTAAAIFRTEY